VNSALGVLEGPYDLILMDPPYEDDHLEGLLGRIGSSSMTRASTTVVVEHSRRRALAQRYGDLRMTKERRYGDTVVSIYQREVPS